MTEAHVPPRACGNGQPRHQRAQWVNGREGAALSSWKPGGLSVYGLCSDCNHGTSAKADPAYIAFHRRVTSGLQQSMQRLLISPGDLPVRVAPGLVARSVLAGMFATNDRLRDQAPDLADGLRQDHDDLWLPPGLQLRLALTPGPATRIGGPVGYMRVAEFRTFHMPLAEVWFPPLAWCLTGRDSSDPSLGPAFSAGWSDASDWIRYRPELVTDLRNIATPLPVTTPPQFGSDSWVLLTGDNVMSALDGRLRP